MTLSNNFLYRVLYNTLFTFAAGIALYTATIPSMRWFFALSTYGFQLFALKEFFQMADKKNPIPDWIKTASFLSSAALFLLHGTTTIQVETLAIGYLLLLLFCTAIGSFPSIPNSTNRVAYVLLSAIYVTIPLLFIIDLGLFSSQNMAASPPFWLISTICIAKGSDIAAYFFGKTVGKTALIPEVSPKKTVEGALFGLLGAAAAFWALYLAFIPAPHLFTACIYTLVAVSVGAISQLSDLIESLFKRDAAIKDSNPNLPGVGGVLDVVDSLIFTAPAMYYILSAMKMAGLV